jgi:transposase InsO family protein
LRQEYEIAETLKVKYPASFLLKVMDINPSGYYKWLNRKDKPNRHEQNRLDLMTLLLEQSKRHKSWGYHRLAAIIRQETGWLFSDNLAHKCCKDAGIRSKARAYHYRKAGVESIRFPNLVKGKWNADRPLSIVVSDMTCIHNKGILYEWMLLLDTFNNEIIAHGLSRNGNTTSYYHCLDVLKHKISKKNGQPAPVVFHTDQGAVFSSRAFHMAHADDPIIRSMSRTATPTDNPIIEALNGWIKEELYLDFNLRYTDDLYGTLDRFVTYFNHDRLAAALDYKSPVQFKFEQGFS